MHLAPRCLKTSASPGERTEPPELTRRAPWRDGAHDSESFIELSLRIIAVQGAEDNVVRKRSPPSPSLT